MPTPVERAEQLFLAALDMNEGERSDYLETQCAGDDRLRRQIDNLLHLDGANDKLSRLDSELSPGARVGPYELREPIGEGGMGIVYRAEQRQPVRRMVAIKLLKPGLDSREIVARFGDCFR